MIGPETLSKGRKCLEVRPKMPTTTNNMARVHPAQPSYFVVVPAVERGLQHRRQE
jgi:hypothetical protein